MIKILIIVTGSIAAKRVIELCGLVDKQKYQISCVLTNHAKKLIDVETLDKLINGRIYDDLFAKDGYMDHINLSRQNDLILVMPASADFIGKMANGLADDLASCIILAANKPIIIAPAMNVFMWQNNAVQRNIKLLKNDGCEFLGPIFGDLACGEEGLGRIIDNDLIVDYLQQFSGDFNLLKNKKIVITAGPTYEKIDAVRFIGNYSSGKQGIAIAKVFAKFGANVVLIIGNKDVNLANIDVKKVENCDQMYDEVMANLDGCDVFIGAAAVADFKVRDINCHKVKKKDGGLKSLDLIENVDILKKVANCDNRPKMVIGFAAESEKLTENAQEKLKNKNCDVIIANNIVENEIFGGDFTQVEIIEKNNVKKCAKLTKMELAILLIGLVGKYLK